MNEGTNANDSLHQIWDEMRDPKYRIQVYRLPDGLYLTTYYLSSSGSAGITIPDIIERTEQKFGGGKYQLRIIDDVGKYVSSKTFEIAGLPKETENPSAVKDSTPIPTKKEARELIIRQTLKLAKSPTANLEALKFLHELYFPKKVKRTRRRRNSLRSEL